MLTISNKEAALLGLLSEKPKHAYEIESDIKERDMRYWTEISMSSVYKLLNKLEQRSFLKSEVKLSKKNVAQKIYSLTELGNKTLVEKIKNLVSRWEPIVYPIDIALANLNLLDKQEGIQELKKYLDSLDEMVKCYKELECHLIESKRHISYVQLATRRIHIMNGEKEWLNNYIEDYKNA